MDSKNIIAAVVVLAVSYFLLSNGMLSITGVSSISYSKVSLINGKPTLIVNSYLIKGNPGDKYIEAGKEIRGENGIYVVKNPIQIRGELVDAWDVIKPEINFNQNIKVYKKPRAVNTWESCEETSPSGKSDDGSLLGGWVNTLPVVNLVSGLYDSYKCNAIPMVQKCCYDYDDEIYLGSYPYPTTTKFHYWIDVNGNRIERTSESSYSVLYSDDKVTIKAIEAPGSSFEPHVSSDFKDGFIPVFIRTDNYKLANFLGVNFTPTQKYSIRFISKDKLDTLLRLHSSSSGSYLSIPWEAFVSNVLSPSTVSSAYGYKIDTSSGSYIKVYYPNPYLSIIMYIDAKYLNIVQKGGTPKITKVEIYPHNPVGGSVSSVYITAKNVGEGIGDFKFDVECNGVTSIPTTVHDVNPGDETTQVVRLTIPQVSQDTTVTCKAIVSDFTSAKSDTYAFDVGIRHSCTIEDKERQARNIHWVDNSGWSWDQNLCKYVCKLTPQHGYNIDQATCTYVKQGSSTPINKCPDGMTKVNGVCRCPSGQTFDPDSDTCVNATIPPSIVPPHKEMPIGILVIGGAILALLVWYVMKNNTHSPRRANRR